MAFNIVYNIYMPYVKANKRHIRINIQNRITKQYYEHTIQH
jgi:hypothetical protein